MAVSLLNVLMADKVKSLLDDELVREDLPDTERFFSREKAEAVIHAALWAYSSRSSSTAGAMAAMSLFDALGVVSWKFKNRDE